MSHLCPVQGLGTAGLLRARFPPKSVALQSLCQIANICVCACVSFFFFFFFPIRAFSLWFNYLLTQVHLLWSFLNVRASDLKCEPSFGLCNSPRLMQTANKGPPESTAAVGLHLLPAPVRFLGLV